MELIDRMGVAVRRSRPSRLPGPPVARIEPVTSPAEPGAWTAWMHRYPIAADLAILFVLEQFHVGPLAPLLRVAGMGYEAASADDAWRRIRACSAAGLIRVELFLFPAAARRLSGVQRGVATRGSRGTCPSGTHSRAGVPAVQAGSTFPGQARGQSLRRKGGTVGVTITRRGRYPHVTPGTGNYRRVHPQHDR